MRVVVDTNVFVSGLINARGGPGAVVDAVIEGRITPVFGSETLAELQDVLARPRLQRFLTRAAIRPETLLARLASIADLVTPGAFVTCLFAGIMLTNLVPKSFPRITGREWPTRTPAVALIADISLGTFLAMTTR